MSRLWCCVIIVGMSMGCSDSGAKLKETGLTYPKWVALDKLSSDDVLRPLAMPASMGDWSAVKAAAKNPTFKSAVDEFAASEVPMDFATTERVGAKEEAALQFQMLTEAAEKNESNDKIEEAYTAAIASLSEVRKPDSAP